MAITEVVAAEAVKEGAKVIAKKVVKEAVKNAAKNAAKNVAKKAIKGALKEKPKKVPLYTDEERAELKSLYGKRNYWKKKLEQAEKDDEYSETITLQDLRPNMSDDMAKEIGSPNSNYNGKYFASENKWDYENRDIREWMHAEGDEDLLEKLLDDHNDGLPEDAKLTDDEDDKEASKIKDKVNKYEEEINRIKKKAKDRQNLKIAKDLARRNRLENADSLAEAFEESELLMSKLSNPEREAVNFVKEKFSNAVTDNINLDRLNEDQARAVKHGVYKAIMDNPLEGLRTGIKETITADIKSKYGNDAGDLVSTLVDVATGKGSAKSIGLELFKGVVNKTGLNPALMDERAEELISMGESTVGEEAMKRFGRDVIVDIGKAIIKSGGQIEIAIPMAIKSILFDAGKAGAKALMK